MKVRNWDKWQSYRRDRGQPPWIKIHRQVMRDPNWVSLTDAQRGQLVGIWLLAADRDGEIPDCPILLRKLCFLDSEPDLQLLTSMGFLEADASVTPRRRQRDAKATPPRRRDDAPETETETETEGERESETEETLARSPAQTPAREPVLLFPVKGPDKTWGLFPEKVAELVVTFSAEGENPTTVEAWILAEAKKARQWCIDNPGKRKTPRGMPKYLSGWLARANDRGRTLPPNGNGNGSGASVPRTKSPEELEAESRKHEQMIRDHDKSMGW